MSGLEQQFKGKVEAHNVDATTTEAKAVCKALGFQNHGLVIRSPTGETLWSQPDHDVDIADVTAKLRELVGE